jgi:putative colanic acid biosynthesis acetyltransferase WcaF
MRNMSSVRRYTDKLTKKSKVKRLLWEIVWVIFFKSTPRWCLNGWRIFLLRIFGASIGKGARVLPSCSIWAPWNLTLGNFSVLGENVDCYSMAKINIGYGVTISQRSFLCTGTHNIQSKNLPLEEYPIIINDFVWICAEAFIGPGVSISEGAVVAARSVVTKDILPYAVVAGNPATIVKTRILINE